MRETRFKNARLSSVGVELLRLSALFGRVPHAQLQTPERVEFALFLVVDQGQGAHHVDFQQIALAPGCVVVVRPGAVQQWQPRPGLDADVLLVEAQWLQPRSSGPMSRTSGEGIDDWPAHFVLQASEQRRWALLAGLLRDELAGDALDDLSVETVHELVRCLLLTLARGARQAGPIPSEQDLLCRRMVRELDRQVLARPSVAALAQQLGTSPSTLGRACRSALGLTVKEVIDRRVALEAKRLLVHTPAPAVAVAERLGFSEPTNFLKFFRRCVGMTPEAFRRLHPRPA